MATVRDVKGDPSTAWDDLSWVDMNSAEQALWAALGWDEASWEEETDAPDSDDRYWEDLTSDEQKAATQLGYTQSLWDEE
ncbi:hypothetical protein ACN4EK_07380 [Pantanalinema rosaneae CENA516]|uniref:hypothetical protein n=1 Tax=Pantanalinema rosaneae TaxID=1620701 RepID=UPI003D6DE86D